MFNQNFFKQCKAFGAMLGLILVLPVQAQDPPCNDDAESTRVQREFGIIEGLSINAKVNKTKNETFIILESESIDFTSPAQDRRPDEPNDLAIKLAENSSISLQGFDREREYDLTLTSVWCPEYKSYGRGDVYRGSHFVQFTLTCSTQVPCDDAREGFIKVSHSQSRGKDY